MQGEQVRYFMGVTLLTRLWQLLGFAAEVRSRLGEIAPHLLTVNLGGTGGAALGSFARGWPNPLEAMWDPEELPRCLEPNIQIRRELTASDFEEIGAATATSPPPQIRELAEDVCSAFGVVRPVLLDPRRRS